MIVVAAVLAVLAALAQAGSVPVLWLDPLAGPVVPLALLAAWAAGRKPIEVVPALLFASVVLGALSGDRVGWILLALLPGAGAAAAVRALAGGRLGFTRRVALAGLAGLVGAAWYDAMLLLPVGGLGLLAESAPALSAGSAWTGMVAMLLVGALPQPRRQVQGLFD